MLDPAQEACVFLDPETPAILLTAGAGTGKTHTLAARLARLLGVEIRRPELDSEKEIPVARADVGRLDPTARMRSVSERAGWAGEGGTHGVAGHAATPESILVLSFTQQVVFLCAWFLCGTEGLWHVGAVVTAGFYNSRMVLVFLFACRLHKNIGKGCARSGPMCRALCATATVV